MKSLQKIIAAATMSIGVSALAGPVQVDFSSSQNLKGLGSFSGSAWYDNTTDKLTLNITNTSGGALTAFAFEVEKGDAAKYEQAANSAWKDERKHNGTIKAKPYGTYQGGAAVNGKWGSHKASLGVAAGQSKTFIFDVSGSDASSLTTLDFFSDTKQPQIVATFAGFKHPHKTDRAGGSGHVVTTITPPGDPGGNGNPPGNPGGDGNPPIIPIPPTNPIPPVVPPVGGIDTPPHGGVAAVPLPPAAQTGMAMLGLFAVAGVVRRIRRMMA